jgi:hypothetical protein
VLGINFKAAKALHLTIRPVVLAGRPLGLLSGKKVIAIESRGSPYSKAPAKATDFQEPYVRTLLGFIAATAVTFIHAEKICFGTEARQAALTGSQADHRESGLRSSPTLSPDRLAETREGRFHYRTGNHRSRPRPRARYRPRARNQRIDGLRHGDVAGGGQ